MCACENRMCELSSLSFQRLRRQVRVCGCWKGVGMWCKVWRGAGEQCVESENGDGTRGLGERAEDMHAAWALLFCQK